MGVHKGGMARNNWNVGTFIKEPIEKIKSKYLLNKQINKCPKDLINIPKMLITTPKLNPMMNTMGMNMMNLQ